MLLSLTYSYGQISPGKLSEAHSQLEGMSNCTQCHDLGNKVPDQKCLSCHLEIDQLINQSKGYHASTEVKTKSCVDCHSDHHGRKFEMTRFDQDNFNHNLTGYKLEGEHSQIDCKQCHQPEFIKDPKIRERDHSFLGLQTNCLSCHDDFHQNTLNTDCRKCHNFESFRPASLFNHDNTKFALRGEHVNVSCLECHPSSIKNGQEFQQFSDIPFNDCKVCHNDPHNAKLPGKCTQCHSESSFTDPSDKFRFNHNLTSFNLKGKHIEVSCFDCHQKSSTPSGIFQDLIGTHQDECIACHHDVHEGKFGTDCIQCHTEVDFISLKSMDFFDHNLTDFPLAGNHIGVDCRECHETKYTDEINFSQCNNCHSDYHNGEFEKNGTTADCNSCHTLEQGFSISTFGVDDHIVAAFNLDGAHLATPCFSCHVSEEKWTFRNIGETCIDCHQDIHENYISQTYYPSSDCTVCHTTDTWSDITFEHEDTGWKLEGEHNLVSCRACHFEAKASSDGSNQKFKTLTQECTQCHNNIHGDQFVENGVTDCIKCHTPESWSPYGFNHDLTNFRLEGKHAEIDCRECHKSIKNEFGESEIIYKIQSFECIDCHS